MLETTQSLKTVRRHYDVTQSEVSTSVNSITAVTPNTRMFLPKMRGTRRIPGDISSSTTLATPMIDHVLFYLEHNGHEYSELARA